MSAWWWWWRRGGSPPDPAEALLNEAAVRFDFSQYTDINDMIDVNGGWGPVTPNIARADTIEFTAEGLHLVGDNLPAPGIQNKFELSTPSPLVFGPDGLTIVNVCFNAAPFQPGAQQVRGISNVDFWADQATDQAPTISAIWNALNPDDTHTEQCVDVAPGYETVFLMDETTNPSGLSSYLHQGLFIHVTVMDVTAQEARIALVTEAGRFDTTSAFIKPVPDFVADPRSIDALFYGASRVPADHTMIELCVWNRAFTEAEVDALVAHFQS